MGDTGRELGSPAPRNRCYPLIYAPPPFVCHLICQQDQSYLWLESCVGFYRQWLPANKLQRLGEDSIRDRAKLMDSKKPNIRRAVQNAYDKAIQHKKLVSTETSNASPQENMDTA